MRRIDSHTMPPAQRPQPRPDAVLERDSALARVSRLRRFVIAGSAALSAAFAWLVSTSPPGKASAHTRGPRVLTAQRATHAALRAPALPPLEGARALGLGGAGSSGQADQAPAAGSGEHAGSGQPAPPQASSPAPDTSTPPAAPTPPNSAPAQPPVVSGGS